jgi:hypothetical protein
MAVACKATATTGQSQVAVDSRPIATANPFRDAPGERLFHTSSAPEAASPPTESFQPHSATHREGGA